MRIEIGKQYKESVKKIGKKLKTHTHLFDCDSTLMFGFELEVEDKQMRIWYSTENETKTIIYSYASLKRCEVCSNGYILTFSDKYFLYLPVTRNEKNNIELFDIGEVFNREYDGFHFVVTERLSIPMDEGDGSKKIRVGFSLSDSPIAMIILALLSVIMATFFVTMKEDYAFVDSTVCDSYNGFFEEYDEDSKGYVELHFEDGEVLTVHQACGSEKFFERLETVEKGEKIYALINPNVDFVVEINTEDSEILNIEMAQNAMLREATGFMWLGIFVYCAAAFLIVYGLYKWIKERKQDRV